MRYFTAAGTWAGWGLAVVLAAWGWWGWRSCPDLRGSSERAPVEVVARVEGEDIRWEDVEFRVLLQQAQMGLRYEGPEGEREEDRLRRGAVDALVDAVLLAQEAARRGYTASQEEVHKAQQRLLQGVPPRTELARRLAAGHYREVVERWARRASVGEKLVAGLREQLAASPQEVEQYYRANRDVLFRIPEQVFAAELSFADLATAQQARARLLQGEDPEKVAEALGGSFRRSMFSWGITEENRTRAVWGLAVGQTSRVVATPEGTFVVLKVTERQPQRVVPLEEARPRIERLLQSHKHRAELQRLVLQLRSQAKIERYWPLQASPSPAPTPSR